MSRGKKAFYNTIFGFADEIVTFICGLILPRLILMYFGSSYNGIVSSVTQFISFVAIMKAGIGGVTKAALYKSFAKNDTEEINVIVSQTQKFMRRIAVIFILFAVAFAAIYPVFINKDFDWFFSFSLIIIISLSTFSQYYFGLTYQMVLNANQKQGIPLFVNSIQTILNTIISVILIVSGCGIHVVKLGSAFVFVLGPILLSIYTKKKYNIKKVKTYKKDLLKQRWDAFGHETANFVNNNTDIIVLTIFTSLPIVSVYTVYYFVVSSLKKIVNNFVNSFGAAFGDMYARSQFELMQSNLRLYEMIIFSLASVLYTVAGIMITPFVLLYTSGVYDINYSQPVFGVIIVLAGAFNCFRLPYETIVKSAGHFKQTRNGSFLEAGLNIIISIVLTIKFGLIGVAIGTLVATVFRTFQFAIYLSTKILKRSLWIFVQRLFLTFLTAFTTYCFYKAIPIDTTSIVGWILMSTTLTIISFSVTLLINYVFYKDDFSLLLTKIRIIFKRRKKQ